MRRSRTKNRLYQQGFPTRSHTVAAEGGVAAALGNMGPGQLALAHVRHRQGCRLVGDQDAIEYLCRNAPEAVYELTLWRALQPHRGWPHLPASLWWHDPRLRRRPAGTAHRGGSRPYRACHAAHPLWTVVRHAAEFFIEYFAIDLIMDQDGGCRGVVALKLDDGTLHRFCAKKTILATGGYGPRLSTCTSAHTCTGDGNAMVLRAGLPLEDMEFCPIPPDRRLRCGRADYRRRAWRGWLPHQRRTASALWSGTLRT